MARLISATDVRQIRSAWHLSPAFDGESVPVHAYAQRSALVVGGGSLGQERADALTLRGIAMTVDASFGTRIGSAFLVYHYEDVSLFFLHLSRRNT